MSVSINNVYQKVLALANKEQRGYITPQEFNLFAEYAQLDIFNKYFDDLRGIKSINSNADYYNNKVTIEEKISPFEIIDLEFFGNSEGTISLESFSDLYLLGDVTIKFDSETNDIQASRIQLKEINKYKNTSLGAPTKKNPVYVLVRNGSVALSSNMIKTYPTVTAVDSVFLNGIVKPSKPSWTYAVTAQGEALFNNSAPSFSDFDLHSSEENNLVIKILQLAGISIKDGGLVQASSQEEMKKIQQEKQ